MHCSQVDGATSKLTEMLITLQYNLKKNNFLIFINNVLFWMLALVAYLHRNNRQRFAAKYYSAQAHFARHVLPL